MARDVLRGVRLDGAREAGMTPDGLRRAFGLLETWVEEGVLPGAAAVVTFSAGVVVLSLVWGAVLGVDAQAAISREASTITILFIINILVYRVVIQDHLKHRHKRIWNEYS